MYTLLQDFIKTHDDIVAHELTVHTCCGVGKIENVLSMKSIQREDGTFLQLETETETHYVNPQDIVGFTHL